MIIKKKAIEIQLGDYLWMFGQKMYVKSYDKKLLSSVFKSEPDWKVVIEHICGELRLYGDQEVEVFVEDRKFEMGEVVKAKSNDVNSFVCKWVCVSEFNQIFARCDTDGVISIGKLIGNKICVVPPQEWDDVIKFTNCEWEVIK